MKRKIKVLFSPLLQFSSVVQSCPTLCDPMDCSTPSLPVHHQLPESTQTHVHRVGDAIQPSHPLSSPSPPALNLSQHQGLFKWVSSLHQVAKGLEFQLTTIFLSFGEKKKTNDNVCIATPFLPKTWYGAFHKYKVTVKISGYISL